MTAPRRCRCRACIAESLRRAIWHLYRGRILIAAHVVLLALGDLMVAGDPICARGRAAQTSFFALGNRR